MKSKQQAVDLQHASLVEPFAFRERVRKPDTRVDFIPVLDMIVIAMLLSLLFTRFVAMPGVRVDLPTTEMHIQHSPQAVAVLTIGNNGMLFFDGAVFEQSTIERGLSNYISRAGSVSPVLLVKAEFTLDMQDFLHLCEMAKEAGFAQLQLAGKLKEAQAELLPAKVQE